MNFTKTAILAATLLATSQAALAHRTIEFSNRCDVTAHVDIVYLDHDGRTRDASYTLRPRSGDTGLLNAQGKRIRTNSRSLWFKARAGSKVWSSDGMGSGYRFYRDTWDRIDIDLKCRLGSNYDGDAPRPDLRRSGAGGGGSANSPWKILETDLGQLLQSIGTSSTAIKACGKSPYRNLGMVGGGFLGGFAAGAAAGAICDAIFGGATLGACTVVGSILGGVVGAFAGAETVDVFDGWDQCAGAAWATASKQGVVSNQPSAREAVRKARAKGRLLAVFSDDFVRCGAVSKSSKQSFAGIGSTAGRAEKAALELCKDLSDGPCSIPARGRCNAWTR